jgi:hypothetical protein
MDAPLLLLFAAVALVVEVHAAHRSRIIPVTSAACALATAVSAPPATIANSAPFFGFFSTICIRAMSFSTYRGDSSSWRPDDIVTIIH